MATGATSATTSAAAAGGGSGGGGGGGGSGGGGHLLLLLLFVRSLFVDCSLLFAGEILMTILDLPQGTQCL